MATLWMNRIAYGITFISTSWLLFYMMVGGTVRGKAWFGQLASNYFQHAKEGVPIMTLAIPILLSGSVCMLLLTRKSKRDNGQLPTTTATTTTNYRIELCWQSFSRRIFGCLGRHPQQGCTSGGDTNMQRFCIWCILVPSVCYLLGCIYRHVHGKELSDDDFFMEVGNSFGMMALVVMSYFLIPVSKQSPILKLLNWSPAHAVQLHIWSGRTVFWGIVLHGGFHMYRWKFVAFESVWSMILPPLPCWTLADTDFEPTCVDPDSDCSCYDHFRNLTGVLALVAAIVIGITSMNYVRRNHYNLFYKAHVLMAPLAIITTLLHYNKSILYIAPSILYYVASSAPVMMESYCRSKHNNNTKGGKCNPYATSSGTRIVSIETIQSEGRPCVGITFDATPEAMEQFCPGQYVNLSCPEISSISHPFTINQVPLSSNQLRIIFRVMGSFTKDLAYRLEHYPQQGSLPKIQLQGYQGSQLRTEQVLQHDTSVMVAGGIGITPFLSVLHQVYDIHSNNSCEYQEQLEHGNKNDFIIMNNSNKKVIVLHWVCRDTSLIEYVKREYFTPLLRRMAEDATKTSANNQNFQIRIVIHKTAPSTMTKSRSYTDLEQQAGLGEGDNESTQHGKMIYQINDTDELDNDDFDNGGVPFTPSKFAAGSKKTIMGNLIPFLTFSSIAWIGLALSFSLFQNVQHKHETIGRIWAAPAIVMVAVVIGGTSNIIMNKINNVDDCEIKSSFGSNGVGRMFPRGQWWSKVKLSDVSDDEEELSDPDEIEMEVVETSNATSLNSGDASDAEFDVEAVSRPETQTVILEESVGQRPTAHQFLKCIDKAECPGLFSCGPTSLMRELRDAAEVHCSMRIQQCICGDAPQISIYEEAFEM